MTDENMDFETASGQELNRWYRHYTGGTYESFVALRDAIWAECTAKVEAQAKGVDPEYKKQYELLKATAVDREREAAERGWRAGYVAAADYARNDRDWLTHEQLVEMLNRHPTRLYYSLDHYVARTYPAPAPSSVTLSDGSVVTYIRERDEMRRENVDQFNGSCRREFWPGLLNRPTDTGADFETLKAFAATVEAK